MAFSSKIETKKKAKSRIAIKTSEKVVPSWGDLADLGRTGGVIMIITAIPVPQFSSLR
jgi:hypothetical protein